jgi:hypothetical protein
MSYRSMTYVEVNHFLGRRNTQLTGGRQTRRRGEDLIYEARARRTAAGALTVAACALT